MSVTLTYDTVLSRVRISATGLSAAAGSGALFERSRDQITWSTVRGGATVPIVASAAALDDYEFSPGVTNYYRVSTVNPTFVGVGTAASADNANVTPGLPASVAAGDVMLLEASIEATTGSPNTPAGYTLLVNNGNLRLFGKVHSGSEVAPTVSFTGGSAGTDTLARMCAFRNVSIVPGAIAIKTNSSAQNIDRPALAVPTDNMVCLYGVWKADDWSSVTAGPAGWTSIGDVVSTAGNDAAQAWSYLIQTTKADLPASTATVTGGVADVSASFAVAFPPARIYQSSSIVPTMTSIWIKNPARPFLNRSVTLVDWSDITRPARGGLFDVVGRSYPVAVTDVRGSRRIEITVQCATVAAAEDLELCLAVGDTVHIHVPPGCPIPGMYAVVGDISTARRSTRGARRYVTLPLTEVAMPDLSLSGSTNTWQTVINTYATWADLIAAKATWQAVLEGVAAPGDVIVP